MLAQYLGNVRHLNSLELAPPGNSMRYNEKNQPPESNTFFLNEHVFKKNSIKFKVGSVVPKLAKFYHNHSYYFQQIR